MGSQVLYYGGCEVLKHSQSHFLDSCFLCRRPIALNCDIFMYRGNTPFCSEECRQEQMEIDEAKERRWKLCSSSKRASRTSSKNSTD